MALADLPAGLLRAVLSSGLWRTKPLALKQLRRPGSERSMKNTQKKEGKFNGPLGIIPPQVPLLLSAFIFLMHVHYLASFSVIVSPF